MNAQIIPRVLYVEDDEDASFMLGIMLGFLGIEVIPVKTIAEALRRVYVESFNLYLLSSRFPNGSGLELCQFLRGFAPHTPIVFYSGDAYPSDRVAGILAGANAYLVKPDLDTVAPTIFRLIQQNDKNTSPQLMTVIKPEINSAQNFC